MYYIGFVIYNLIFDFSSLIIYKNIFNIKAKNIYLIFLQILSIVASVVYLFCLNNIVIFILLKLIFAFVIILLTTENFSFKYIFAKWMALEVLLFFTIGIYIFLSCFYYEVVCEIFNLKNAKIIKNIIIIVIFTQYMLILSIIKILDNRKKINNFLGKIEFSLLDEHIKIMGLIDTGNSLYDTKTKFPIIIVGLSVLKKRLSKNSYQLLTVLMNQARVVECVVAGGKRFKLPIIDVSNCKVCKGDEKQEMKFVVGVLENCFYDVSSYECLLHRDFV